MSGSFCGMCGCAQEAGVLEAGTPGAGTAGAGMAGAGGWPHPVVGPHSGCEARRALEPPRYCACCGRRMVVQVTPGGWTARCSRHGELSQGR